MTPISLKLVCPRLYLDTNVLVDALLENREKYRVNNDTKMICRIESSRLILDEWPKENLMTSPYALGEFIGVACTRKFGRSYNESLEIAIQKVVPRCRILHSKVEVKPEITKLMEGFPLTLEREYRSDTRRWGDFLPLSGGRGRFYSGPTGRRPSLQEVKSMFLSAPAFETLLFAKASEIRGQSNADYADAIILTYVRTPDGTNEVDIVCSNDGELTMRWNENMSRITPIQAMSTLDIIQKYPQCRCHQAPRS